MLRRLTSLVPAILVLLTTVSSAQTADKLVAKNLKARGGVKKLKAIDTLSARGTYRAQGFEFPFTMLRKRPNLFLISVETDNGRIVQAHDGETVWGVDPTTGATKPALLPEKEAQVVRAQADLEGFLAHYREKGRSVELVGKEEIESGEAYKLEVTLEDGFEMTVYLDTGDHLERRIDATANVQGTDLAVEVYFSDYRPVAGVLLAHRQVTRSGGATVGELEYTSVEAGVEIADAEFAMAAFATDADVATELTVEEILERYLKARGGERLQAANTFQATGKFVVAGGVELPVTIRKKRPNRYRADTAVAGGQEVVQAHDGKLSWWIVPPNGIVKAEEMPPEQARLVAAHAGFDGLLLEAPAKGFEVELVGTEELEGQEVYHLKVAREGDQVHHFYLDTAEFLERKVSTTAQDLQGNETEVSFYPKDYRPVDGVLVAHTTSYRATGSPASNYDIRFDDVAFGVDVDDDIFLMPGQMADPSLSLDAILARHIEARGGAEAARSVRSLKATGKVSAMGFELPMVLSFKRPQSLRVDVDLQGLAMMLAFDGEVAWLVSPMQGIPEPEEMPPEARDAVAALGQFIWGLFSGPDRPAAELMGIDKVDRHQVYHLKVTTAAGDIQVFLGGEDFLEHKLSLDTGEGSAEAYLSDFRPVADALLPHSISSAGGPLEFGLIIEDVEVNAEIDDAIFTMPVKEEAGS